MARPKKENTGAQATVRIEKAFWDLLETEQYSDITVLRISQESGTNRNSFYYHYRDIEDLAYKAFMHNADGKIAKALFSSLLAMRENGGAAALPLEHQLIPHAEKIMLCARSDSPFLHNMVHDLLKQMWLGELGIDEERLSPEENLQICFIFSGLVAALGSPEVKKSPHVMATLSQTDIGKTAVATLMAIAGAQKD